MRLKLFLISLVAFCSTAFAQTEDYNIVGLNQGKNGAYNVTVTTKVKKVKEGIDILSRCAVHGVMFRGFNSPDGGQKALIADPNVEKTKATFFQAFFNEGGYKRYVTVNQTSFASAKSKGGFEVKASMLVDKESLREYLEKEGIIKGFSNLW